MKRLMVVLASVLVLGGCASYEPAPQYIRPDKVVLDWKDFMPIQYGSDDYCNTVRTNSFVFHKYKTLCFVETSTKHDNHFVLFNETEYKDKLSDNPIMHVGLLVNESCTNKPKKIGFNARVCETYEDGHKVNKFYLFRDFKKDNYNYSYTLVVRYIPIGETIHKDSAAYKTALNIANDSLKKL